MIKLLPILQEILQESVEQITAEQAAEKILSSNGAMFTVTFHKQDGSERVLNGRLGVTKHLQGGTLRYDAKEKGYVPVYDMQIGQYRMITIRTITALKIGGKQYEIV